MTDTTSEKTPPRTTMRALQLEEFGADLNLRDLARPVPGPGQGLVRIAASGVNPLDLKIKAGEAAHAQVKPPAVLGVDLAGTVVDLGPGVDRFDVGDKVYGMTGGVGDHQGSLAEYAAVDVDLLAAKPTRLSMVEAAALPLVLITAWIGLVDRADVQPGQTVLVHGGAGGVGHVLVQLARAHGAVVYATGRRETDLEIIRGYGAHAIDAATPVQDYVDWATGGVGFDVVYDTIGGSVLDASFTAVRRYTGHVVSILGWGTHSLAPLSLRGATYSGVFALLPLLTGEGRAHHGEILARATDIIDAGSLTPRLDATTYGWETVHLAHHAVKTGTARGKVVIDLTRD